MNQFNNEYSLIPFGIKNFGSTCYFNSFLQALITCTSFNKYILLNENLNNNKILQKLMEIFDQSIKILSNKNISNIAYQILNIIEDYDRSGKNNIKLKKNNHNDSDDILSLFFNYLDDNNLKSLLSLFMHRQRIYIYCSLSNEEYEIQCSENYVFYLPQEHFIKSNKSFKDYFLQNFELIDNVDCRICDKKHNVKKKNTISYVPEIIIVRVIRYLKKNIIYDKIPFNFNIPINKKNNFNKYEMIAHIEHTGNHYYSVCRRKNNSWVIINDNRVIPISTNGILSNNTYLIFYHLI
jgi:ubiquitin C-terminal hydrolase